MSTRTADALNLDLDSITLHPAGAAPKGWQIEIVDAVIDGSLERTVQGASTLSLTVNDPHRELLQSGVWDTPVDVEVQDTADTLWFRLVKMSKQADALTLVFEDREVNELRHHSSPRHASRSAQMTRAEFILSMVREVTPPISFVCPQIAVVQPLAHNPFAPKALGSNVRELRTPRYVPPPPNVGSSAHVTYSYADLQQLWEGAGGANSLSDTMAAIALAESSGRSWAVGGPNTDGSFDYGCWQINSSHGLDTTKLLAADQQYNAAAAVSIEASQGLGAWSTYKNGAYQRFLKGGGTVDTRALRRALPYQFRRGKTNGRREDSWTAMQRLAKQVNWRCFCSAGTIYYESDLTLLQTMPRFALDERSVGVQEIDFDLDAGKKLNEATITCRAERWPAGPGWAVSLTNMGPADGDWIVWDVQRGLFQADATITIRRPQQPIAEPARAVSKKSSASSTSSGRSAGFSTSAGTTEGRKQVQKAYSAAQKIDQQHYPYVWGGGHGFCGIPSGGIPGGEGGGIGLTGYDCSGSTCAVLGAANMGFRTTGPVWGSGQIASSWGAPGEGVFLTVWANSIHVFMVFHTAAGDQHFGTGLWGKSWDGPGFNTQLHPTAGFTPRHWPGT